MNQAMARNDSLLYAASVNFADPTIAEMLIAAGADPKAKDKQAHGTGIGGDLQARGGGGRVGEDAFAMIV